MEARDAREIHLVAGAGGDPRLDPIFGCAEHDGRVCVESAHGAGGVDAVLHTIDTTHDRLRASAEALRTFVDDVGLGREAVNQDPVAPRANGDAGELGADGRGQEPATAAPEYPSGGNYDGLLQPGDETDLLFNSDTSGSINPSFSTPSSPVDSRSS